MREYFNGVPYVTDELHISATDRDKAMYTHLRHLARRIQSEASRFTDDCNPADSLCGSAALHPFHIEDIALKDEVIKYTKANWKRIGDISFAWGLIQLVRLATKVHREGGQQ